MISVRDDGTRLLNHSRSYFCLPGGALLTMILLPTFVAQAADSTATVTEVFTRARQHEFHPRYLPHCFASHFLPEPLAVRALLQVNADLPRKLGIELPCHILGCIRPHGCAGHAAECWLARLGRTKCDISNAEWEQDHSRGSRSFREENATLASPLLASKS
jgi:hypothetical protein